MCMEFVNTCIQGVTAEYKSGEKNQKRCFTFNTGFYRIERIKYLVSDRSGISVRNVRERLFNISATMCGSHAH